MILAGSFNYAENSQNLHTDFIVNFIADDIMLTYSFVALYHPN